MKFWTTDNWSDEPTERTATKETPKLFIIEGAWSSRRYHKSDVYETERDAYLAIRARLVSKLDSLRANTDRVTDSLFEVDAKLRSL